MARRSRRRRRRSDGCGCLRRVARTHVRTRSVCRVLVLVLLLSARDFLIKTGTPAARCMQVDACLRAPAASSAGRRRPLHGWARLHRRRPPEVVTCPGRRTSGSFATIRRSSSLAPRPRRARRLRGAPLHDGANPLHRRAPPRHAMSSAARTPSIRAFTDAPHNTARGGAGALPRSGPSDRHTPSRQLDGRGALVL